MINQTRKRARHSAWPSAGKIKVGLCPAILFFVLLATTGWGATPDSAPLHSYSTQFGIEIQINSDGSIRFVEIETDRTVLTAGLAKGESSQTNSSTDNGRTFTAKVSEGAPGGRRGQGHRADDDDDGLVDEDPLDGQDNDGDNRVDEDYAAISDAMIVVSRGNPGFRTEHYHWAYSHLTSAAFFTTTPERGREESYKIDFDTPAGIWQEAEVFSRRHSLTGKPKTDKCVAYVSGLSKPGEGRGSLWAGVMVLGSGPGPLPENMFLSNKGRLGLKTENQTSVVICVAESWLQLNRLLVESSRVFTGVKDPVTDISTPWIVPPLCSACRGADQPGFCWSLSNRGDLELTLSVQRGQKSLVDPDLFSLAGVQLGCPVEITWKPDNGQKTRVRWIKMVPALLQDQAMVFSDPYRKFPGLLGHESCGELSFRFSISRDNQEEFDSFPADKKGQPRQPTLTGRWLDGRQLTVPATRKPENNFFGHAAKETSPGPGQANLSLSADLLQGWPNPFRETIQVRFQIPQTVKEAFLWDDGRQLPAGMDMLGPVPWHSGSPVVTIKIYRINGQELTTLFQGRAGNSKSTVQWDGKDEFGRPVASGSYFCKLQMDEWSVTKRIVFLR